MGKPVGSDKIKYWMRYEAKWMWRDVHWMTHRIFFSTCYATCTMRHHVLRKACNRIQGQSCNRLDHGHNTWCDTTKHISSKHACDFAQDASATTRDSSHRVHKARTTTHHRWHFVAAAQRMICHALSKANATHCTMQPACHVQCFAKCDPHERPFPYVTSCITCYVFAEKVMNWKSYIDRSDLLLALLRHAPCAPHCIQIYKMYFIIKNGCFKWDITRRSRRFIRR